MKNKHVGAILNENGVLVNNEKEKRDSIRALCAQMYQQITINQTKVRDFLDSFDLSGVGLCSVDGAITKNEVREAISQLKKGKAPGPDGLPNEMYLSCVEEIVNMLTSAYNDGIKAGKMHPSFYHGIISLIYKKGPSVNLDNWGHVTLMNVDYKVSEIRVD